MIVELNNDEFFKVMHMLNHNLINLEIKSVVYNFNPGWIFVDDPNSPQTALGLHGEKSWFTCISGKA